MGWLERLEIQTKAQEDGFIPENAGRQWGYLPRTLYNYGAETHEGRDSNVVMSPVQWIMRNFTEARPVVQRVNDAEVWQTERGHDLETLLRKPNPFYWGDLLWKATLISYTLDGNGYWQKVRNTFGEVIGLWYIPHFLIEPKSPQDGSVFISHYEYRPIGTGRKIDLAPRDVVHHRFGLDPDDPRMGFSPLKPILREVFTDNEAANFSASILRNMGVPGGVIAPKDAAATPSSEDVKAMKDYMQNFRRDKRGEWLVLGKPTEISQFGFNPQNLMLGNLRDIAEERVCAAFGIPAAVVGFGAGLQQTKVGATMRELVKLAWISCITPMQRSFAEGVDFQLLPDFTASPERFRVKFDNSDASAFTEEETEKARRIGTLVEKGVLRVDRAQEMAGLEVDPTQRVYLRPGNAVPVGPDAPQLGSGPTEGEQDDELARSIAARLNNGQGG
jgi:HK97 family phage portal protein